MHETIEASVLSLLKQHPSAGVFVAGHSLVFLLLFIRTESQGGALAAICAASLTLHHGLTVSMFTFGQPRVGNQAFASFFNETGRFFLSLLS